MDVAISSLVLWLLSSLLLLLLIKFVLDHLCCRYYFFVCVFVCVGHFSLARNFDSVVFLCLQSTMFSLFLRTSSEKSSLTYAHVL